MKPERLTERWAVVSKTHFPVAVLKFHATQPTALSHALHHSSLLSTVLLLGKGVPGWYVSSCTSQGASSANICQPGVPASTPGVRSISITSLTGSPEPRTLLSYSSPPSTASGSSLLSLHSPDARCRSQEAQSLSWWHSVQHSSEDDVVKLQKPVPGIRLPWLTTPEQAPLSCSTRLGGAAAVEGESASMVSGKAGTFAVASRVSTNWVRTGRRTSPTQRLAGSLPWMRWNCYLRMLWCCSSIDPACCRRFKSPRSGNDPWNVQVPHKGHQVLGQYHIVSALKAWMRHQGWVSRHWASASSSFTQMLLPPSLLQERWKSAWKRMRRFWVVPRSLHQARLVFFARKRG